MRAALGYDERPLVVCSVGGTVGADLLGLCAAAYRTSSADCPVCGWCSSAGPGSTRHRSPHRPASSCARTCRACSQHFAASDVAVVQGGGHDDVGRPRSGGRSSTSRSRGTDEARRGERIARHCAGQRLSYAETTPQALAEAIASSLGQEPAWPPIPADGARRAAALIHEARRLKARREQLAHPQGRQDDAEAQAEAGRAVDVDAALVGADG